MTCGEQWVIFFCWVVKNSYFCGVIIKNKKSIMEKEILYQSKVEAYLHLLRKNKFYYTSKYGITRIGIFGSVARGEQTENSDIDICIESPPMGLFVLSGLCIYLEELLGMRVDIIRMHKNMNLKFRNRIEKEIIYV